MSRVNYICLLGKNEADKVSAGNLIYRMLAKAECRVLVTSLMDRLKRLCPQLLGETEEHWKARLLEVGKTNRSRYGEEFLASHIVTRLSEFDNSPDGMFIIIPDIQNKEEYDTFACACNALTPVLFLRLLSVPDPKNDALPELEAVDIYDSGDKKMVILRLIYGRYLSEGAANAV